MGSYSVLMHLLCWLKIKNKYLHMFLQSSHVDKSVYINSEDK
jgi:hypothetical protein